jgi:hypothetical protein
MNKKPNVNLGGAYMQQALTEKYLRGVYWSFARTLKAETSDMCIVFEFT